MKSVKKQLKEMQKQIQPNAEYKNELWTQLSDAFDDEYRHSLFYIKRAFALPLAALVVFISMGTGTYAYASPQVHNEHALYPVKMQMEKIEGSFKRSANAQVVFEVKKMERRLAEGKVLLNQGGLDENDLEIMVDQLQVSVDQMIDTASTLEQKKAMIKIMQVNIDYYDGLLEATGRDLSTLQEKKDEDQISNKIEQVRVRIIESDKLTAEEKRALFPAAEFDPRIHSLQDNQ